MGIYANIAENCSVTWSAIDYFLKKERNKDILEEVIKEREKMVDLAKNKLKQLIDKGHYGATKFLLATKGGFVEKQEIESNIKVDMDVDKIRKAIKDGTPYK